MLTMNAANPYREHRFNSYKTLPACNDGDILFVGNSITNMMNWWEAFGSRDNIRGRGNSGAVTQELITYFDDIVKGNPAKVFIMIGTNDLGSKVDVNVPDTVAARIETLLAMTREKVPDAEIYYQSILPSIVANRTPERIKATNNHVKEWIDSRGDAKMIYIDLFSPFADENGDLKMTFHEPNGEALSFDGLHLSQQGYKLWLDIIKDYVGYEPVYGKEAKNEWGDLRGSNGMRVSYFGALPVKSSDILLIGDEMIHNGEWQERLNSTDIKDRGIGWGFPGMMIKNLAGSFDAILKGNIDNGVIKETPKAIALYSGTGELEKNWSAASLYDAYSSAIAKLRELAPNVPIYAMTLLPYPKTSANRNEVIRDFNSRIANELVNDENNIFLIDVYEAVGGNDRTEDCFMGEDSPYLSGEGYKKVADVLSATLIK